MCDPVSGAISIQSVMGWATAATAATTVYGQQVAADAQNATNERQYQNTMQAYRENVAQSNLQMTQEQDAASQKIQENNLAARRAMGTAQVSAGESGITGLSVDALLGDLAGQQAKYNLSVADNLNNKAVAVNLQRENAATNAASQINQLKTPAMPDYVGAGLRIATTYNDYRSKNPLAKKTYAKDPWEIDGN